MASTGRTTLSTFEQACSATAAGLEPRLTMEGGECFIAFALLFALLVDVPQNKNSRYTF